MTVATPTASQVIAITGSTVDSSKIDPFAVAAQCLVESVEDCTTASQVCKDEAAVYVMAHLFVLSPIGRGSASLKREEIEGVINLEYAQAKATGDSIKSTGYGVTANALLGGCLAQLDLKPINIFSLGSLGDAADFDSVTL